VTAEDNNRTHYVVGTSHIGPSDWRVGDRVRMPQGDGRVTCAYPLEITLDAAIQEVVVTGTVRVGPCPCGGTWGVCSFHGGPRA